jgi:hypothetical protein
VATLQITVPDALVPRVITALRATYPDLTEGLNDGAASRAVIRYWVRTTVQVYEGTLAAQQAADQQQDAEQTAWTDTEVIT